MGLFKINPWLNKLTINSPSAEVVTRDDMVALERVVDDLNLQFEELVLKEDPDLTNKNNISDDVISKRFIVTSRIYGDGGMATVSIGWDKNLLRPVIIKSPRPFLPNPLIAEAQTAARIQRLNIPIPYEVFDDDDTTYFVMDYISGPNLREYIDTSKNNKHNLTNLEIFKILSQVSTTIDKIHSTKISGKPIIHRDIKPSNIIINPELGPFIVDLDLTPSAE